VASPSDAGELLDGKIAVEPVTVDGPRGFGLSGRLNVGRLPVVAPTGFESRSETAR
jgi:hypothetical protein